MISERHYSRNLYIQLDAMLRRDDVAEALPAWLSSLSRASFRTAGYILGEQIAPRLPSDRFWFLFLLLVRYDARAFLVTMLKALLLRLGEGSVSLDDEGFLELSHQLALNAVDRQKTLRLLLPHIDEVDKIRRLFLSLGLSDEEEWIPFLVDCSTLPAFYLLFLALRRRDHELAFMLRLAVHLAKRGDALSFNMASLMKAYFGLEELRGTFSLTLSPYELSRIELSFPVFCQKMCLSV